MAGLGPGEMGLGAERGEQGEGRYARGKQNV